MLNSGCSILDVGGWSLASGIALLVARCVSRGENQINPQFLPAHALHGRRVASRSIRPELMAEGRRGERAKSEMAMTSVF
jgi:hypothetical protein